MYFLKFILFSSHISNVLMSVNGYPLFMGVSFDSYLLGHTFTWKYIHIYDGSYTLKWNNLRRRGWDISKEQHVYYL